MPVRIEIRETAKRKLTNMEHQVMTAAKSKAAAGHDQNFMRLFIEEEIKNRKKLDRYRNAELYLVCKSKWEMVLQTHNEQLAVFKTIY